MPTDEQYGRQLAVRLRYETDDVRAAPDLAGRLRRRRARRAWAIRAAVATPLAAATVAGVLVTAGPAAPISTHWTERGTAPWQNVAYVQAQTVGALSRAAEYVILATTRYGTGYYDQWTDKATHRYRNDVYTTLVDTPPGDGPPRAPAGPPSTGPMRLTQSHSASGPLDHRVVTTVDYDRRTWSVDRGVDESGPSEVPDITDAAAVRKAIRAGRLELLGPETVDGRDTLHLRISTTRRGYRIDMWVDRATYLPVRSTDSAGGQAQVVTTYSWLPRTEENLARLVLTPPRGFVRT